MYDRLNSNLDTLRSFQEIFRLDGPALPAVTVSSAATDCSILLTVSLEENDYPKRWDGTNEINAITAIGLFLDLRSVIPNSTRRFYRNGHGAIELVFDETQNPFQTRLRYGGSSTWEVQRYGQFEQRRPMQGNPFYSFVGSPSLLTFDFSEDESEHVVTSLKAIFAKCASR